MEILYEIKDEISVLDFLEKKGYSRNLIIKLKKQGIMINDNIGRLDMILKSNDMLKIIMPDESSNIVPINGKLNIVYEDSYILVLYKPHGIATIPTRAHYERSLANYIMSYFIENGIKSTIHLVNRLDLETAGLVLVAKSSFVHNLFSRIDIKKKYYALVHGALSSGIINLPIKKCGENTTKRMVSPDGKEAITKYEVIKVINDCSLVDIELFTGRTHQIRVHFSHLGYPLVGDSLYGHNDGILRLESYYLSFIHPISGELIEINKDYEFIKELNLDV